MTENDTLQSIADGLLVDTQKEETVKQDLQNVADELNVSATETKTEEQKEATEQKEEPVIAEEKKYEEELIELVEEEKKEDTKDEPLSLEDFKDIGVEVKNKGELKELISSLKNENVTLKAKADEVYANEDIKKLNDFVKDGGDLKAYTSDIQRVSQYKETLTALDKVSPVEAYKYGILQQFGVKDVSELSEEKQQEFNDYVDSQPAFQKELEGRKLINAEKAMYQAEVDKIEQGITQAQENLVRKNEAYANNVSKAVQALTGVDGIKVKESEKADLANRLKNPKQFLQDLMPLDKDGLPDVGALVRIGYRELYGKRNMDYLKQKSKSEGKKEVFEKIENSTIKDVVQHSKSATTKDPVEEAVMQM